MAPVLADSPAAVDLASLGDQLAASIDHGLADGASLRDACAETVAFIKLHGLAEAVIEQLGSELLSMYWKYREQKTRARLIAAPLGLPSTPGQKLVNPKHMNSRAGLLESLQSVGNRWILLGDMDRGDCQLRSASYFAQADGNRRRGEVFKKLAARLHGEQRVRDRFTEEKVRAMFHTEPEE